MKIKRSMLILLCLISISAEESSEVEEYRNRNILFTSDLYKELLKTNTENFVACPFSIETVLALIHTGAAGNTAKELANGLHFPDDSLKILQLFKVLEIQVNEKYTLNSVNKLYLAPRFSVNENYKYIVKNIFKSEIETIDLDKKSVNIMNKWVEDQTQSKIKNLIKEDYLTPNTVSVLINTIYFNANWLEPFQSTLTKPHKFHINKDNEVEVDMMYTVTYANLHNDDELRAQFLELPYEGNDAVMTFVLPNEIEGLSALENNMKKVLQRPPFMDESQVTMFIPKFKIETSISLEPIMKNLGIKEAFSRSANFSRMTTDHGIFLSHVKQKAFIEVTEKGTTAGAATFAISEDRSFGSRFVADHPFIFILRHRVNGILFVGKYVNPIETQVSE